MDYYNGYTPKERGRKLRASYRIFPNRTHPLYGAKGCQICGNPACPVEPHTEDYSLPYLWDNPAEYAVCKTCHGRLHKRFKAPAAWEAYKRHIKRGGYGADLKDSGLLREVRLLAQAIGRGENRALSVLRDYIPGDSWWDSLTMDPASLTALWARPRP